MVKIYLARAMSGRVMADVVEEAKADNLVFDEHGITVLCPVISEGVKPKKQKLQSPKSVMDVYWPRDKAMIREANVLVDMTPHLKSQGVEREAGYARYFLWKPVVRVFPKGQKPPDGAVPYYEDDVIVDDIDEAARIIKKRWGTRQKRFIWRIGLYKRCIAKAIAYKALEWVR